MIKLIACMGRNRVIGKANGLPWDLPEDMRYFRQVTTGHPVLMGRKTFESIGKALPGRDNLVLSTTDWGKDIPGIKVMHSIEEALDYVYDQTVFVIGGEAIYEQFLPHAEEIYVTKIDEEFDGDAYFPVFELQEWEVYWYEIGREVEQSPYTYGFYRYKRRQRRK